MSEVDALTEVEARFALQTWVRLTERLADTSDAETRVRIVRMLTSTDPNEPLLDIGAMVDRLLDERDELRRRIETAVQRLDRLSGPGSATAAILKGEA